MRQEAAEEPAQEKRFHLDVQDEDRSETSLPVHLSSMGPGEQGQHRDAKTWGPRVNTQERALVHDLRQSALNGEKRCSHPGGHKRTPHAETPH